MSKKSETNTNKKAALKKLRTVGEITEYVISTNGLHVLYVHRPNTEVVTSNIVYRVGSRDELPGETGLAHMLEHMLFKPTRADLQRKQAPASMRFEREVGVILNANTWKDRTCYYFSYPKNYLDTALQIEAERIHEVLITDKEFLPERTNVLSEFDMYAGDELFVLSMEMMGVAFQSHPYGHETIGYREDIEAYTTQKLDAFYKKHYTTHNATLIIIGDVTEGEMKSSVLTHFGALPSTSPQENRREVTEPKQTGMRTTTVIRPSETQVYGLGVRHPGFPSKEWFETMILFDLLAGGEDSILYKKLVDTGLASRIQTSLEPSREENLGIFFITLSKKISHEKMHALMLATIHEQTAATITPFLVKTIAKVLTSEYITRENTLSYAQELVEYASAQAVDRFFDSESILKSITPKDIERRMKALFREEALVVGHFIGKNNYV